MKRHHFFTTLLVALLGLIFADTASAMYHPGLGRHMQRDPNGMQMGPAAPRVAGGPAVSGGFIQRDFNPHQQYADGMNLYQYVRSNPVRWTDPSGLNVYAIDGTWTDWGNGSNTEQFYRKTNEKKYYWEGPNWGTTGLDASGIYRGVRNQICEDDIEALDNDEDITINLVGWSRGATVALEVAQELDQNGCCRCRAWYGRCTDRVYPDINFMGLFDAVDMTITAGWADEVAPNVQNFAHAMKTENQRIFPTTPTGGRYFWRHNGDPTTHADIGMNRTNNDAYSWIVGRAIDAGVDISR